MLAENKIRVTAIQRLCVHDGPGVRTTVFLKGCYLQCPWCCNPETLRFDKDLLYDKKLCKKDKLSMICRGCIFVGGNRIVEECPIGAFERTYKDYEADELYDLLMKDKNLYERGGGITISGGEPLLQARPIASLLQRLKESGIHISVETSLYAPFLQLNFVKPYIDYWIIDLKYQYGYIANPDAGILSIDVDKNLLFIQNAVSSAQICYRMVVMKEIVGKISSIAQELKSHHVNGIELLAYHYLGKNKYKELGKPYHQFGTLTKDELEQCVTLFNNHGVDAHYMTI